VKDGARREKESVSQETDADHEDEDAARELPADEAPVHRRDPEQDSADGLLVGLGLELGEHVVDARLLPERDFGLAPAVVVRAALAVLFLELRRLNSTGRAACDLVEHLPVADGLQRFRVLLVDEVGESKADGHLRADHALRLGEVLLDSGHDAKADLLSLAIDGRIDAPVAVPPAQPRIHPCDPGRVRQDGLSRVAPLPTARKRIESGMGRQALRVERHVLGRRRLRCAGGTGRVAGR
jgi:hypothetical protein